MNLILAILATLRITRFLTSDTLGHWLIVRPARKWAIPPHAKIGWEDASGQPTLPDVDIIWDSMGHPVSPLESKRVRLVSGLDCPHCVSMWAGAAVLLSLAIARAVPPLIPVWRFVMGTFALSYITGHLSSRIDG